jgi:hypothetical protein
MDPKMPIIFKRFNKRPEKKGIMGKKCLVYVMLCLILALLSISACSGVKKIHIKSECGVMMNNVFNTVNSEDDCRAQCRNQCSTYDLGLSSSTFVHDSKSGCNTCDCVCR